MDAASGKGSAGVGPSGLDRAAAKGPGVSVRFAEQAQPLSSRVKLLIAALLLTAVPLLIALAVLPQHVQATLTALGQARLVQVADDLATFTQKTMELHLENVRVLSTIPSFCEPVRRHNAGTLTPEEIERVNRDLLGVVRQMDTELQGTILCGKDGISFAGVLQTGDTKPYEHLDIHDRAYFAEVKRTLRPLVSDPLYSRISGVPVLAIVAPILDERGDFAGLLGVTIKISHLSNLVAGRTIGEAGYPFAIDRQGILVAHPDPDRFFSDALIRLAQADQLVRRMVKGERGIERYVSSKGAQKIAAFAPVPICGWSIGASIETTEFEAPAHRIRLMLFVLLAAAVLTALMLAVGFSVGFGRLKTALADARTNEIRFKLFANIAGGAVWDWNPRTDEFWWNEGLATTFGWTPAQVATPAAFRERLPAAERDAIDACLQACVNQGDWSGEHHFLRADGTPAYVLQRAAAIRGPEGRTERVLGSITDISSRRAIERKMTEQAALLDQTRDGIVVQDLAGVIRFWNAGAEQLYGWTAAEALGRRPDELLHLDAEPFAEASRLVLQDGQWAGRLQKRTKAGNNLTLDSRWTLLRDESQRAHAILTIDTDVTERLQMEDKFLRTQRLESIGTLAGGIAHDLNNLLAPILMGTGLLKLTRVEGEEAKILDAMERSAQRGAQLVNQVLSFARGVEGTRVSVHVGYVVREVESMVRSTFPKNIKLRCEVQKNLRLVRADPTQLNQVLLNLCVNARDAMPAGGTLTISVRTVELDAGFVALNRELTAGPHVCIEVADTGTGIPEDVREKIFEPFFTTKEAGKGTGLGLATVIGIVRGHGGSVNVYSELGKGSTFKIYLPATIDPVPAPPDSTAADSLPLGHGELILLVDDEPAILGVSKQALESRGYRTLLATDGAHALALYHQHRAEIALVLTDMMMPLMDGHALVAALRRSDTTLPVVAASGLNDHNNQLKALEVGITHFIAKPYTATALIAIIQTALQARTPSAVPKAPDSM